MTDQLLDTLIDDLTVEQRAEMQRIVDTYDQPFEQVVNAVKGASPKVLEALTISLNLPAMLKGEPVVARGWRDTAQRFCRRAVALAASQICLSPRSYGSAGLCCG